MRSMSVHFLIFMEFPCPFESQARSILTERYNGNPPCEEQVYAFAQHLKDRELALRKASFQGLMMTRLMLQQRYPCPNN